MQFYAGGSSAEREISLATGNAILGALKRLGYKAESYDLDHCFYQEILAGKIDRVFIALHGKPGEDGTVQGFLELLNIPYTGSGVLASALAMDKLMAKEIFWQNRLPTPPYEIMEDLSNPVLRNLSLPVVLKPVAEGSAVDVYLARNQEEFDKAVSLLAKYPRLMVEEYIKGREFTVGVLGDRALPVLEIIPNGDFYDYNAKYTPGESKHEVPASIPPKIARKMQEVGLLAHRALGCSGATRSDIILDEERGPYLLEVNTIPGMTETSLLPEEAGAMGISFDELVEEILKESVK